jgi:hypothetical protein
VQQEQEQTFCSSDWNPPTARRAEAVCWMMALRAPLDRTRCASGLLPHDHASFAAEQGACHPSVNELIHLFSWIDHKQT